MVVKIEFLTTGGDNNGADITNVVFDGQVFTIGTSTVDLDYPISSVDVFLSNDSNPAGGTITASIYELNAGGFPTGSAQSTGTMLASILTAGNVWFNITMSAFTLKKSTAYALVLSRSEDSGTAIWRDDATSPPYAGGTQITSTDTGSTWATQARDKIFQINGGDYAGTLCTLADAVNKAGANASSNSTNESLVSSFVLQAESLINSATRKNWTDAYSGLNDDVKFLLNQMASDLAAINIITYDMAGYTSRVEAESMINIYRESFNRGLFFLLDNQVETFMEKA